uniref:Uncharacterized protein n=1 Tax=candidate division WOR-3 bacterium TaxID=2052148 RepID=A0A7V1EJ70_UNCW3
MKTKIIFYLVLAALQYMVYGENTLTYRIELTKDTIYFGEPIIVKCKLINRSERKVPIFSYPGTALLTFGYTNFYLSSPSNYKDYKYGVYLHSNLLVHSDSFTLDTRDSVYYYTILSWIGFTYLKYNNLKQGWYKIRSTYFSLESNVDSFYADALPAKEKEIFEEIGAIVDTFWVWPEGGWPPMRDKIRKVFPNIIKQEKSVFSPFCYYMLWRMVFNDESKAEFLAEEFFKLYPDSPLTEKFAFDLYRYYGWYKKDEDKGRTIILDALEKYPDNLIGYFYLKLKNKKERSK